MRDIKELSLEELKKVLKKWDMPAFHAQQIFAWIYKKGVKDSSSMSNLPLDLRGRLKENFYLNSLKSAGIFKSRDGTAKFVFELRDGNFIEAVTIPAEKRITGCISTQVGCKFNCRFCASGMCGFKRNLTTGEMLEEVLYLKNSFLNKKLTHIVFMGTGEPLDNYDNLIKAVKIINAPDALNIGARRITISTCGIIPGIERLADENLQIELSISLHAADDKIRSSLMPINKKYPLKNLISACEKYTRKTRRQITFEYILIRGINSDLQNAQKLSRMLKGLKLCKVNLIPCNPIEELKVESPERTDTLLFRDYLLRQGINAILRKPRGQDINAACGQLRLDYENSR